MQGRDRISNQFNFDQAISAATTSFLGHDESYAATAA
jgi:hypothetical protein